MTTLPERLQRGRELRRAVPRSSHEAWHAPADRPDPVSLLEASAGDRVPELVGVRYGRMAATPFTFLRGAAEVMAADLATTPATGVDVQCCGDSHLMNFGFFGTPERDLVFGLNDFDETTPGPWEWDVKRLVASAAVAARTSGLPDATARGAVEAIVESYRSWMWRHAQASPLDVWYDRVSVDEEIAGEADADLARRGRRLSAKARRRQGSRAVVKLVREVGGRRVIADDPPYLFHPDDVDLSAAAEAFLRTYRESLPTARRTLLDRYELLDAAVKVVGVGSVGTRCLVALLGADEHSLLLQVKEAGPSALAPYVAAPPVDHEGERVVVGQQLLQSASDLLLGWGTGPTGRHFYVRQLRDMKLSVDDTFTATSLVRYGRYCGRALARGHANTGSAAAIAGYLGRGPVFDRALGRFAAAYAEQNDQDHRALLDASRAGRVPLVASS